MRRVVVTGIGTLNPLGITATESWNNLIQSKSGIKKIPDFLFDTTDYPTKIAGIIPPFNLDEYISPKDQRKMDKFIHYGVIAADEAIKDSGIDNLSEEQKLHAGVIIGSGIGGLSNIYENSLVLKEKGPRRISPFFIPSCLINLISGNVSIKYGLKGPNHSVVTACSTGAHAIGDAARIIIDGDANVMVAGGAEAAVTAIGIAGFNACRALSTNFNDNPEKASRPWDKARDGFVMGEGAGVLVLEELEHAKNRGANIYAEVIGYGLSGDAYHITAPEDTGEGGFRAMQMAARKANISPKDIDYINAHGTSTPLGDMIELSAVKRFMGDAASTVSMSSTKSSIGHLLGAAGAVEAIFAIKAINENIAPPTLNLENPDEGCDIDLVPLHAKKRKIDIALSNSFGFGGTNASLLFKRYT